MVKYIAGGILFSAGVEAYRWQLPSNFRPIFGYRSDNSHCCSTVVLSGSQNGIDGTYREDGERNGRKYYVSDEGNKLTGETGGLWLFQEPGQSGTDGLVGYFTNNQCVVNQMVSTDDWKEYYDGQEKKADYIRVTCATDVDECRTNICPSGTCVNTVGGYDCDGAEDDWNQCDDNGGAVCRAHSSCVEENPGYSCACDSGFEYNNNTDTCDDVLDCENNVCGEGADVTCTDIPGSYECGCESGWVAGSWADGSCQDENECDSADTCASNSESTCKNLEGDYECQCNAGWEHESSDDNKSNCIDIDECATGDHTCGGGLNQCNNNDGGFECVCNPQFSVQNGNTCEDILECSNNASCPEGHLCIEKDGEAPGCECPSGFEGDKCEDSIDDCTLAGNYHGNCTDNSKCVDGHNSWSCECHDGYEGPDCTDIDSCAIEGFCSMDYHKCYNGDGFDYCMCADGFKTAGLLDSNMGMDYKCEDINECDTDGASCPPNSHCVNTYGGYACNCDDNYETNPDDPSECRDVDECTDNLLVCSGAGEKCQNTPGSASCVCMGTEDGWTGGRDSEGNCASVDDCADVSCGDNKHCVDGHEDYSCACDAGFEENGQDVCVNIDDCADDPCADDIHAKCVDGKNEFSCECANTEFFTMVNGTCTDINECDTGVHTCVGFKQVCNNKMNGFDCACEVGWKSIWSEDSLMCVNINECADGYVCSGANERCEDNDGGQDCFCQDGFGRPNGNASLACENLNECDLGDYSCHANSHCEDSTGSYTCECDSGFVASYDALGNDVCNDINECAGDVSCPAHSTCRNNVGSWGCACDPGYEDGEDGQCVSITDCDASKCTAAHEECVEDEGLNEYNQGYHCVCSKGYEWDSYTGNCEDADDCNNGNIECPTKWSHCESDDAGWGECVCDDGFTKVDKINPADNSTYWICEDNNECLGVNNCHENAECSNFDGGYSCACVGEYSGDGETCIICPSLECWTFNADTNTCTPKDECSELECGSEGFKVGFVNELFGIDNSGANFIGDQPTLVNETSGEWELISPFGTNSMTFEINNETDTITFYMVVSLGGDERARSDFEQTNSLINLGDRSIMTTPFGVGMLFSCQYSTVIELSSVSYTVEDVSISDSQHGSGDWSSTFSLSINGGSDSDLILGQMLPVAVTWSADGLVGQLEFYIRTVVVTHGSTKVAIVRESCLSAAAGAVATSTSGMTRSFEYKLFKGVGESTTEQTIDVSVVVCKPGECGEATSSADCPEDGENEMYQYFSPLDVGP